MAYYHIKGVKDLKVTTVLQTSPLGEVYVPSLGLAHCHRIKVGQANTKAPPPQGGQWLFQGRINLGRKSGSLFWKIFGNTLSENLPSGLISLKICPKCGQTSA